MVSKRFREGRAGAPKGQAEVGGPRLVRCPYCGDGTKIREDRLETHVRRQHPTRKARTQQAEPRKDPSEGPAAGEMPDGERSRPEGDAAPSGADVEAGARLSRLAAGTTLTGSEEEEEAVRDRLAYLARVGGLLLPHAFAFAGRTVLFTGDGPYEAGRLAPLLPEGVSVRVDDENPNTRGFDVVVVGRKGFDVGRIKEAVIAGGAGALHPPPGATPPRFVPQEGFLDEVLFGRNWWTDRIDLLNAALFNHAGLARAKELMEGYARRLSRPEARFRWPSVEAEEAKGGRKGPDPGTTRYPESTPLRDLGYQITGLGRPERWRILTQLAVPRLGLREVAETIARHCRERKRQAGGAEKYELAITEWEHDLARLKRELYDSGRRSARNFQWPSSR